MTEIKYKNKKIEKAFVRIRLPKKCWYSTTNYIYKEIKILGKRTEYWEGNSLDWYLVKDDKGEMFEVSEGNIFYK